MSVKHNLGQWVSEIDSDGMCDISDNQVIALIRGYAALEAKCAALAAELESAEKRIAEPVAMPDESAIFEAAIDICRKSDAINEHAWNHGVLAVMSAFRTCRATMLHGAEPAKDNTNQQFESLSRGDK